MSVPLDLRDALYRSFLRCHRGPISAAAFRRRAAALRRGSALERRYWRDRVPRYEKVLRAWRKAPPGDLEAAIDLAGLLFSHGLYFEAHEYLETLWRRSEGRLKLRLQGLIQLAAALHKLELDPGAGAGASYLVKRGFEKLEGL